MEKIFKVSVKTFEDNSMDFFVRSPEDCAFINRMFSKYSALVQFDVSISSEEVGILNQAEIVEQALKYLMSMRDQRLAIEDVEDILKGNHNIE